MPGEEFTPNPGADEDTQQPELTGVDLDDPKVYAQDMFKQRFDAIHKKYEADESVLRSISMPSESAINEEMSADLAGLKEEYKARNQDLYAKDPQSYRKQLASLKSSYHTDQFAIKQKYDRQLRQQNRAYDQQRAQLDIRKNQELDIAEKRSTYETGKFHVIDDLEQAKYLTSDQARRERWKILGVNVPTSKDPDQQRAKILSQIGEIDQRLSQFVDQPEEKKGLYGFRQTIAAKTLVRYKDENDIVQTREATPEETLYKKANEINRTRLQNEVVKLTFANDPTIAAREQIGKLTSTKVKTGNLETNVSRGPSQVAIQKQQEAAKPKKLDKATRQLFLKKANMDKNLAIRMAAAAGYE